MRIKEKYAVLVPHAKTRLDLNYIIGEMIAELAWRTRLCESG